ncbi:MAG: hypothetical protein JWP61_2758 [Friedmanniella sp.]|nr:hypothetical protein [Friedmanniella sp.]
MSKPIIHLYGLLHMVQPRLSRLAEKKERGATAVEYGLLVGLIAVVIIVAVRLLGNNLLALFNNIAGQI